MNLKNRMTKAKEKERLELIDRMKLGAVEVLIVAFITCIITFIPTAIIFFIAGINY